MISPTRCAAIVVDYRSGDALVGCLRSLRDNGVQQIVVVDNAAAGGPAASRDDGATWIQPGVNLGYGRGVNRGVAAVSGADILLISNPDIVVHPDAVTALLRYLEADPHCAIVGPRIVDQHGDLYPSRRGFPSIWLAAAHALAAPLWPNNPWTRRYRSSDLEGSRQWLSGAFFAVRRDAFEALGGFDEQYFMFAEDMDLCWRLLDAGWRVGACDEAVVTHFEGVSRRHAPAAMVRAHHVSAMRFEWQHARGLRRLMAPVAVGVLLARWGLVRLVGSRRAEP